MLTFLLKKTSGISLRTHRFLQNKTNINFEPKPPPLSSLFVIGLLGFSALGYVDMKQGVKQFKKDEDDITEILSPV